MSKHIRFKIVSHRVREGTKAVEILFEDAVVATMYPGRGNEVCIVSAHFEGDIGENGLPKGITFDSGKGSLIPIPVLTFTFEPKPYKIEHGEIVKQK